MSGADEVAALVLAGFQRHFARMREVGQAAQGLFERRDWATLKRLQVERLDWYDARIKECLKRLADEAPGEWLTRERWPQVKRAYIALLLEHRQPELAEVFFNSITARVLPGQRYVNEVMFIRPSVSTEYLDLEHPSARTYYPRRDGLRTTLARLFRDFGFTVPFAHLERDVARLVRALRRALPRPLPVDAGFHLQVLRGPMFRGQEAHVVGRAVNGPMEVPFVVPLVHDGAGQLVLDGVLVEERALAVLFSSTRAYFLADVEVPSAWVGFLKRVLPSKPTWELYALLGFGRASKAQFYRELLHHFRHSTDTFVLAPGTPGLVMVVFTLPSFPYVFKLIRDRARPPKDVDRATVVQRYREVKRVDRVGRMADTLEYADVALPRSRLAPELLEELRAEVPSLLTEDGPSDTVVLKHLYLERRLTPLDMFLQEASPAELEAALEDYGRCLEELAAVDIFAGDLLYKNFGVTRLGRVVFYDYDEIAPVTALRFRALPTARGDEDELRAEAWYEVGPRDVFPEEWRPFLCTSPEVKAALEKHHARLFTPGYWNGLKRALQAGTPPRVPPYPQSVRFARGDATQG